MKHLIPKDPEQRWEWVKYQLRFHKTSISALAREHKVCRQAVQVVSNRPSPKWEAIIARKIGIKARIIWPERYSKRAA